MPRGSTVGLSGSNETKIRSECGTFEALAGTALVLHSYYTGTTVVLYWYYNGTTPALYRYLSATRAGSRACYGVLNGKVQVRLRYLCVVSELCSADACAGLYGA